MNGVIEVVIQLHKRSAYNGTLLNECRSLFNQFDRPAPSEIIHNTHTISSPPSTTIKDRLRRSPRLAAKYIESQSSQLESHYIVYSAVLVSQPKHFTDTLSSLHSHYWKLAAFEHFDQNADTILCSIPFPVSQVPRKYNIYRPILAPKVKTNYKLPNHFNLKIRWF